jgi:hypothetical protein
VRINQWISPGNVSPSFSETQIHQTNSTGYIQRQCTVYPSNPIFPIYFMANSNVTSAGESGAESHRIPPSHSGEGPCFHPQAAYFSFKDQLKMGSTNFLKHIKTPRYTPWISLKQITDIIKTWHLLTLQQILEDQYPSTEQNLADPGGGLPVNKRWKFAEQSESSRNHREIWGF